MWQRIDLVAENISAEELFDNWQELLLVRESADARLAEVRIKFEQATDPAAREQLWSQLEFLWPNYQVLLAWAEVMHAGYVFSTEGAESVFIEWCRGNARTGN